MEVPGSMRILGVVTPITTATFASSNSLFFTEHCVRVIVYVSACSFLFSVALPVLSTGKAYSFDVMPRQYSGTLAICMKTNDMHPGSCMWY